MLWVLFDCSLSVLWLLTYSWLIALRFEPEWWILTALDKFEPYRRTHIVTPWVPIGAKNLKSVAGINIRTYIPGTSWQPGGWCWCPPQPRRAQHWAPSHWPGCPGPSPASHVWWSQWGCHWPAPDQASDWSMSRELSTRIYSQSICCNIPFRLLLFPNQSKEFLC